ncbi:hypothetical protein GGX14DRAFT_385543 [Mycena pura]|uniref:Uncharacterized protein n=1 Tax=Mycena pura TaxID=153505 RepID=A0AAD7E3G1_9AGAR|nr:hypothetical protein GGX14DRAFT_385543 [Mycena pura]
MPVGVTAATVVEVIWCNVWPAWASANRHGRGAARHVHRGAAEAARAEDKGERAARRTDERTLRVPTHWPPKPADDSEAICVQRTSGMVQSREATSCEFQPRRPEGRRLRDVSDSRWCGVSCENVRRWVVTSKMSRCRQGCERDGIVSFSRNWYFRSMSTGGGEARARAARTCGGRGAAVLASAGLGRRRCGADGQPNGGGGGPRRRRGRAGRRRHSAPLALLDVLCKTVRVFLPVPGKRARTLTQRDTWGEVNWGTAVLGSPAYRADVDLFLPLQVDWLFLDWETARIAAARFYEHRPRRACRPRDCAAPDQKQKRPRRWRGASVVSQRRRPRVERYADAAAARAFQVKCRFAFAFAGAARGAAGDGGSGVGCGGGWGEERRGRQPNILVGPSQSYFVWSSACGLRRPKRTGAWETAVDQECMHLMDAQAVGGAKQEVLVLVVDVQKSAASW